MAIFNLAPWNYTSSSAIELIAALYFKIWRAFVSVQIVFARDLRVTELRKKMT